jgi:hypothetical protein
VVRKWSHRVEDLSLDQMAASASPTNPVELFAPPKEPVAILRERATGAIFAVAMSLQHFTHLRSLTLIFRGDSIPQSSTNDAFLLASLGGVSNLVDLVIDVNIFYYSVGLQDMLVATAALQQIRRIDYTGSRGKPRGQWDAAEPGEQAGARSFASQFAERGAARHLEGRLPRQWHTRP